MGFDKHLFISYAHLDDQPLPPQQQGWITRFHAALEAMLSMRIGSKATIWRDDRLQGNDVFAKEIFAQFPGTAMLISVLTPRYLNSEWCTREIDEFCKVAEQNAGVVLDNKCRVFKVLKTPVDVQDALPAVVRSVLGYEFFVYDEGAPLELDPVYEKYAQDYNRKLGKLAWDVAQLLKKLQAGAAAAAKLGEATAPAKPTVYLAECSYDRREAREMLEGDLKLAGYTVLPDHELPRQEADYVAEVGRLLARSSLSIHLVGASYGAVPDGPDQKSVGVLQNELAVLRARNGALKRLIWLPEGTRSEHLEQQAYIEALHGDVEAQFGADLITAPDLEQVKSSIHATLKKLETPKVQEAAARVAGAGARMVHLICNEKDRKASVPLRKFLRDKGVEVEIPAFEGDAADVRAANQALLTSCDAVLVFYGAGDEAWKRSIDNELKKAKAFRSGAPLLATYTYLAEPHTADKQDLVDLEERNLINGMSALPDAEMSAFVQALRPGGEAP